MNYVIVNQQYEHQKWDLSQKLVYLLRIWVWHDKVDIMLSLAYGQNKRHFCCSVKICLPLLRKIRDIIGPSSYLNFYLFPGINCPKNSHGHDEFMKRLHAMSEGFSWTVYKLQSSSFLCSLHILLCARGQGFPSKAVMPDLSIILGSPSPVVCQRNILVVPTWSSLMGHLKS